MLAIVWNKCYYKWAVADKGTVKKGNAGVVQW